MSETAIHENGMSMILCDLCTRYPSFRDKFCAKFTNFPSNKKIDYMYFSGNIDTGFGKPDITIRFTNGDFFYIEVKTKRGTIVQPTQEYGQMIIDENNKKIRMGYVGLLEYIGQLENIEQSYGFLVDKGHPGFESDKKEIILDSEANKKIEIDVITWEDVKDAIKDEQRSLENENSRLKLFLEDIKKNVDCNEEKVMPVIFDQEELIFFKSILACDKQLEYFESFYSIELTDEIPITIKDKKNNDNAFKVKFQSCELQLPYFGWKFILTKILDTKAIKYENMIWIGFNPYIMDENNIVKYDSNILDLNSFRFCLGIYGDLLSKEKLKKSQEEYCLDNAYWYYFPLINNKEKIDKELLKKYIKADLKEKLENYLPDDGSRINVKKWEE